MRQSDSCAIEARCQRTLSYLRVISYLKRYDIVSACKWICQVADDEDMAVLRKYFENKTKMK